MWRLAPCVWLEAEVTALNWRRFVTSSCCSHWRLHSTGSTSRRNLTGLIRFLGLDQRIHGIGVNVSLDFPHFSITGSWSCRCHTGSPIFVVPWEVVHWDLSVADPSLEEPGVDRPGIWLRWSGCVAAATQGKTCRVQVHWTSLLAEELQCGRERKRRKHPPVSVVAG